MRIRVCATRRGDAEALDLIDRATEPDEQGKRNDLQPNISNNVKKVEYAEGNGAQYAIRKLRKDRPDMKECGNAARGTNGRNRIHEFSPAR